MTEKEIAEKIKQASEAMAEAVAKGYNVTVRTSKDGISIYKEKRTKIK